MPAVHSPRRDWASATLHSCQKLSILARDTRRQPGETRDPLTHAHRPLKKRDVIFNAGCTLSPSTFCGSLGRELPEMRLGEYDSLHSCQKLSGDIQVRLEIL